MARKKAKKTSIINTSIFSSFKIPLSDVLRNPGRDLLILNNYAASISEAVTLAYQIIRFYILDKYNDNKPLPLVDEKLFETALSLTVYPDRKIKQTVKMQDCRPALKEFYETHFKPLINSENLPKITNVGSTLQKLRVEMFRSFKNNIAMHYYKRLSNIIGVILDERDISYGDLKSKERRILHSRVLKAVLHSKLGSLNSKYQIICHMTKKFIPEIDWERGLAYDLEANTLKFLNPTLNMAKFLEENGHKLFQSIPLRSSVIPKNFPINSTTLKTLMDCEGLVKNKKDLDKIEENECLRWTLWNHYFKLDKRAFSRKGYDFFHSIDTDGFNCTLKFIKKGADYKKYEKRNKFEWSPPKIEDLTPEERQEVLKHPLVGCDPGKGVLLQIVGDNRKTLRYTQRQRTAESKHVKYRKIRQSIKSSDNIKEIERPLNDVNSMTVDIERFKSYIRVKSSINLLVKNHYKDIMYRKLKFYSIIKSKNSLRKFLNKVEETFGSDCKLLIGDWSRPDQMKGIVPTPGIGIKKESARKFKGGLFDIIEFGSSKYCACCYKELKKYKINGVETYRILVCNECSGPQDEYMKVRFVHRDINSSINHRNRGICELKGLPIPSVFLRSKCEETEQKPSTVQEKKKTTTIVKKFQIEEIKDPEKTVSPKAMVES